MIITSAHDTVKDGDVARCSVRIGARCWLGARVTVLPGVTIGEGAVIAAGGSQRDCEPGAVYAGVPARRMR